MRNKILILCLICFFILASCISPADPEIEERIKHEEQLNYPIIEYFSASPTSLWYLEKSTLRWKIMNVNRIEIDNGIGEISTEGMKEVAPAETTIYILTATNEDGNVKQSCKVSCRPAYLWDWGISDSFGNYTYHVYGTVINRGWTIAHNPKVIVTLYESGIVVAIEEQDLTDKYYMNPGEKISWHIIFDDSEHYIRNNQSNIVTIATYLFTP